MLAIIITGLALSLASLLGIHGDPNPHPASGSVTETSTPPTRPETDPGPPTPFTPVKPGKVPATSPITTPSPNPDPVILPASTVTGIHHVATGYPQTQEGAAAQLAAIEIAALQQPVAAARKTLQAWSTNPDSRAPSPLLETAQKNGVKSEAERYGTRLVPMMARFARSNPPQDYTICLILSFTHPREATRPQVAPDPALTQCEAMTWRDGHWIVDAQVQTPRDEQMVPGSRRAVQAGYRRVQTAAAPDQR